MRARARVHGAITIVNAIATGKGAALGIGLETEARVELVESDREVSVTVQGEKDVDTALAQCAVREALSRFSITDCGARVETLSEIPIAKGLKSSSAAA